MTRSTRIIYAVPLLLAACGGSEEQVAGGGAPQAMAVQVHVLHGRPLDNAFITTGSLLPNEEVELRSEVSGRVTHIGFEEGRKVSAGQVLVHINDDDLQAQLRKAEANLKLATDAATRQEQLLAVKGLSQEAYDAAVAQRIGMQAEVDNLRAAIAKTTIRAPFSGTIGLRSISEGGYVSPTGVIARLAQTDPMKLDFAVPERYALHIKPGMQVAFTLEADTMRYTAEVYAVEPSVDASTRTVKVRARTQNPLGRLVPGAFAKVEVRLATITDALTIPAEALIPDIQGQKVMVMKDGKAKSVRVDVGIRTENEVQLISNVQPGDTVITSALLAVRDGMPLRPAARKDEASDPSTDSAATAKQAN
ncbi:MAG: efflux RND transporter periplasmic adaptor subunit [Flavobacteriales bacterium]|nr:efflux RND transporter periplasmic adaptor subunit [Flavobacteriales bacterium]